MFKMFVWGLGFLLSTLPLYAEFGTDDLTGLAPDSPHEISGLNLKHLRAIPTLPEFKAALRTEIDNTQAKIKLNPPEKRL